MTTPSTTSPAPWSGAGRVVPGLTVGRSRSWWRPAPAASHRLAGRHLVATPVVRRAIAEPQPGWPRRWTSRSATGSPTSRSYSRPDRGWRPAVAVALGRGAGTEAAADEVAPWWPFTRPACRGPGDLPVPAGDVHPAHAVPGAGPPGLRPAGWHRADLIDRIPAVAIFRRTSATRLASSVRLQERTATVAVARALVAGSAVQDTDAGKSPVPRTGEKAPVDSPRGGVRGPSEGRFRLGAVAR